MMQGEIARRNAHLLYDLRDTFGATDFGSISGFFDVDPDWRCPCCYRSKSEMARLDRNNNLLCAIHNHHDHFEDEALERITSRVKPAWGVTQIIRASLSRFPETMICNDCNVAEPYAKNIAKAPPHFSFAPYEIANFIISKPNEPHTVDDKLAAMTYEAAIPTMKLLARRLAIIIRAAEGGEEQFEPIAQPALRVLREAEAKMRARREQS